MTQHNLCYGSLLAAIGAPEHSIGLKNCCTDECMLPLEIFYGSKRDLSTELPDGH